MLSIESILEKISNGIPQKDPSVFLKVFAEQLRQASGAEVVYCKDFFQKSDKPSQGEEFILNTGTPYLDNSLSKYSSFPELINFFNAGFRSCIVVPIKDKENAIGIISLLSKKDRFFQEGDVAKIKALGDLAAREYGLLANSNYEHRITEYFWIVFESDMPQCLVDDKGAIALANKSFTKLFGSGAQNSMPLYKFFGMGKEAFEKLKSGSDITVVTSDGRKLNVHPSSAPGGLLYAAFKDDTRLSDLEERELFFKYAAEEAYVLMDDKMRVHWVSDNVKSILHIDKEYLIGKKLDDIVRDRDSLIKPDYESTEPRQISIEILLGNDQSVKASGTMFCSASGVFLMLSRGTATHLKLLKKNLDDIIRISGDMIITLDTLGYIKNINKSVEKTLRNKSDNLVGMPISNICADQESQYRISSSMNIAKINGFATDVFINLVIKNGEDPVPSQHSIKAIYDEAGKISGYMLIGRELATKQLLEKLQVDVAKISKEKEDFKEESNLKTQFISSMAHDLRTPITSISGFAKLMLEGQPFGELNDKQKESLQTIIDESARLNELIEHILDAAKLESKKVKLDIRPVDMRELGQNAGIKSLAEVASNKGLAFNYIVDYDVPTVECDPNRIVQVLVNLIGNALKFTEKGSITVHIKRNGTGKRVKTVRIEVKDTGIGINKEDKGKLFKKFFQIEKNDLIMRPGKGTGLGLTIVHEIVHLHDGRAGVESEPGKGSTFWFLLNIKYKSKKSKAVQE
ncbi:MAG: ATP-binding protein [Candidatus Marsarchaeota archaeon]|jgi:signal transduction histidine kinase|nr:ATP-binding protein [Candidatus Marsarchaeota archaeon]